MSAQITAREQACEAAQAEPDPTAGLTYLHSDHLGRPQFGTNASGEVVWDGGITTPFGVRLAGLGAQTQALMFPGQYEDAETTGAGVTLSHNWHRTYDPTIGRYLQADPIGLAGGLNRYAYVGGNPVGFVDPTGEIVFLPFVAGAAFDLFLQTVVEGKSLRCVNLTSTLVSGGFGVLTAGSSIIKAGKAIAAAKRSEKVVRRVVPNFKSPVLKDAIDNGLADGIISLSGISLGLSIPQFLPEVTIGDDCECR